MLYLGLELRVNKHHISWWLNCCHHDMLRLLAGLDGLDESIRKKPRKSLTYKALRSGAEEDRTPDLYIANVALSQLSYRPNRLISYRQPPTDWHPAFFLAALSARRPVRVACVVSTEV
jgi:hypothetical protein